jgi:hypothetical protein
MVQIQLFMHPPQYIHAIYTHNREDLWYNMHKGANLIGYPLMTAPTSPPIRSP